MRITINALLVICVATIIASCGIQYPPPVEIKDIKVYTDQATDFSIKYPGNWSILPTPGKRFVALSSSNAKSRFINYNSEGFPGAKIDVSVINVSAGITVEQVIENSKIFDPKQAHYKLSDIMLDGVAGKKLTYKMELEDGEFRGETYIVSKSPYIYTRLTIETFANSWNVYKKNLNEIIKSFKPATRGNADTVKYTIVSGMATV